jgi:formylglycine-generating enzyme required for sulfatase activity
MLLHILQTRERPEDPVYGRRPNADMVRIPGGTFRMGPDKHYPEEAPVHRVTVDEFWIDRTPVTNRQIASSSRRLATSLPPKFQLTRRITRALCRI